MNKIAKKRALLIILIIVAAISAISIIHQHQLKSKSIKSADLLLEVLSEGEQIRLGSAEATHTLVVFYDYSCTICRRFFHYTLPDLESELTSKQLSILLKPVNLNGDKTRTESYQLLYCLEHYGLFNKLHQVLLLEPDYIYHPDFVVFKENLFLDNIDIQQCSEALSQTNIIDNNKTLLYKLGYSALPLSIHGNRAYPGHLSAEKIKSIIK